MKKEKMSALKMLKSDPADLKISVDENIVTINTFNKKYEIDINVHKQSEIIEYLFEYDNDICKIYDEHMSCAKENTEWELGNEALVGYVIFNYYDVLDDYLINSSVTTRRTKLFANALINLLEGDDA